MISPSINSRRSSGPATGIGHPVVLVHGEAPPGQGHGHVDPSYPCALGAVAILRLSAAAGGGVPGPASAGPVRGSAAGLPGWMGIRGESMVGWEGKARARPEARLVKPAASRRVWPDRHGAVSVESRAAPVRPSLIGTAVSAAAGVRCTQGAHRLLPGPARLGDPLDSLALRSPTSRVAVMSAGDPPPAGRFRPPPGCGAPARLQSARPCASLRTVDAAAGHGIARGRRTALGHRRRRCAVRSRR
jgi:hypothetical protein